MADTGDKVVTISQAARYLGKDVSGGIGDSVITLRQLRAMRDGSKATPTVLPSGYTELEYIERHADGSSDGQYIDTGIKSSSNVQVTADFQYTTVSNYSHCGLFGGRGPGGGYSGRLCFYYNNGGWRFDYNNANFPIADSEYMSRQQLTLSNGTVTLSDGKTASGSGTFTGSYNVYVFANNTAGVAGECANIKLWSFTISDGSTSRSYVPAKRDSDGAIGLYDTIGGQFYANLGSGSFTAGPVVPHSADPRDGLVVRVSQLARIKIGPTIVSWSTGTDEEIAAMVAAADAGKIDLSDYWSAGDTRTVRLSAMPATGVGETHAAQNVQFVLTDPGHYTLANGKACNFVVLQKDSLSEYGYMNSSATNSGGWNNCARRTWCNNVYRNAVPASLRGIFKQFKVRTASGSGSGVTESTDWFSLFSEKEVFGSTTYANSSAESQNTQLNWFKTSSNRIKKWNGVSSHWWERSPRSVGSNHFCSVTSGGVADWNYANSSCGLAPFGCI